MILAFELSSRHGSVALFDGHRVVAQESWDEPAARHPLLFAAVPRVLRQADVAWTDLRAIAAGRGPGAFSGVRVALMAAQVFALPNRTPVLAVSSGEALALDLVSEAGAQPIVIAGDARRGSIWYAIFHRHGEGVKKHQDWTLVPAADFAQHMPEGAWMASPDWARLSAACGPRESRVHWIEEDRYPSATRIAEIAWHTLESDHPREPLIPLYLHPAV
jgi:tRNA threonylcarbamoyladenosine biosynthesis protein TsaB